MSMTGVQMANEAYADYTAFAKKSAAKVDGKEDATVKYTWILFKISADAKTIVTAESSTGKNYANADKKAEVEGFAAVFAAFAKSVTALKEPRFGAIDCHKAHKDGRLESKIVNFRWSPDTCKVGDKMKYSGSEGGFKGKVNAAKMMQCTDVSDITLATFEAFAFDK